MHGDHVRGEIVIRLNTARLKREREQENCSKDGFAGSSPEQEE